LHIERERPEAEGLPQAAAPQLRLERELRGVIKRPAESEAKPAVEQQSKRDDVKPRITRDAEPRSGFASEPPASAADTLAAAAPPLVEPAPAPEPPAVAARRVEETRRRAGNVQVPPAKIEARPEMQLRREETLARQYAPAPAATPIVAPAALERPERWLERIAELRSRGKHAEADKELAEFRRVYPSYPLSEVMRERVEGR
jgi:hypothetical protein